MEATLLVELLTEELPPKSLKELSDVFGSKLFSDLEKDRFLSNGSAVSVCATPRRLAVLITKVKERSLDTDRDVQGPPITAASQAISGFAKKNGVAVEALKKQKGPKGEIFVAHVTVSGQPLGDALAAKVETALKTLPIPKVMRWGSGDAQFVRPVHGLVMMHGARVVPGTVLGLQSSNRTRGHRFMGKSQLVLANADGYEKKLREEGMVVADFEKRKSEIDKQLQAEARRLNASLGEYQDLLSEVTALVEYPSVYAGEFDKAFLEVPQECLILTMRKNQRYFPLFNTAEKILPKFLIVSNMKVADPRNIIDGNQRVVRPRLEDARFFYHQDRKEPLERRVLFLEKVIYHSKLGNQLERVKRLQSLAEKIAHELKADATLAKRAAWLSKADLLTGMVGEFPELQGIMGRYYALHDKEPAAVAAAIEAHYRPRFAGDVLPQGEIACAVALADKLQTLAGLFGIGEQPTGEKDPFGLRRAALGVIRIIVERNLPLDLFKLANAAFGVFNRKIGDAHTDLEAFFRDRMRSYFQECGYSANEVEAVLSLNPTAINLIPKQLEAVRAFSALPEAASLAAANKRIANILRQAESRGESFVDADKSALKEPAEISLFEGLQAASRSAKPLFDSGDFAGYLKTFASLKNPVDSFFDAVMVMADDKKLRENRLALLTDMRKAMNRFADISKLAA